jgi:hypothetical protein
MPDKRQRKKIMGEALTNMPEPVTNDKKINIHMSVNHEAQEEWGHVAYSEAYALFVFEAKSARKTADRLGIPFDTIKTWMKRDKWMSKRKEIETEIMESMHSQAMVLISQNHAKIIKRHLNLGERLDQSIEDCIKDNENFTGEDGEKIIRLDPESINFLAKAFKNSADVTHRIAKINDKMAGDQNAGAIFNGPVQINAMPSKAGKIIDV